MTPTNRAETAAPATGLSRDLGLFTVTMVGVGAMIGAGIFVLTGIAAGTAGPGLILAFAANGVVTLLTALSYAELGSAIPEAGGGYLWVKEGLPGPNAFLAGWMSWFAHAVAGSLYALGFGAYLGLVMSESGWTLFGLTGPALEKPFAVAIAVLFVAINFKGVSETGLAGNVVTVAKIAIIGLFIASGLWAMAHRPSSWDHFTPFLPEGFGGVLTAMGLTYIAFEGYEIIVQAGEEVKDPKRNIPRAVFWSLAIVIPIYILTAVAALGAVQSPEGVPTWRWLGAHQELGLAEAARQFMPLGTTLLLVGGILSTMSALNATTFSSTRVSFAMGRDRNLPDAFARIHERTRTPFVALAASGALIIGMALTLPIHDVAAAADVMFLLLFLQVNVAIITIRRKYGDKLDYGFLVPFFPWLPAAAIVLMLGIAIFMFRFSPIAWLFVLGWIAAGLVVYRLYARDRGRAEHVAPVLLRETPPASRDYRILVAVPDAQRARPLIDLAAAVAHARGGELLLVHAIGLPRQTPLRAGGARLVRHAREKVLDAASDYAHRKGVSSAATIRLAREPARAIVQEAEAAHADLVVMGWRLRRGAWRRRVPRAPQVRRLGSNVDAVLRAADCDVAVLRAGDVEGVEDILVPVSHPANAAALLALGEVLADAWGARLDLLHLVPKGLPAEERERRVGELRDALEEARRDGTGVAEDAAPPEGDGAPPQGDAASPQGDAGPEGRAHALEVEECEDVAATLVRRSRAADLLVLGASREGWTRKLVLGTIPERIAHDAEGRLLLFRAARGRIRAGVLDVIEFLRSREPESRESVT